MSKYDDILSQEISPEETPQDERNKYDDLLGQSNLSLRYNASKEDPKRYSNVVDISTRTGIPAPVVSRNLEQATKKANEPDWNQLSKDMPTISELLNNDPDYFEMAKDKTESLKTLEMSFKREGITSATGKSFMRGLGGLADIYGRHVQKQALKDLVGPAPMTTDDAKSIINAYESGPGAPLMGMPLLSDPRRSFGDKSISIDERAENLAIEETARRKAKWEEQQKRIQSDPKSKAANEWLKKNARDFLKRGRDISMSAQDFSQKYAPDDYFAAKTFVENLQDEPLKAVLTAIGEQAPNVMVTLLAGLATRGMGSAVSVGTMGAVSYTMEGGDIFSEGADFLEEKYNGFDNVPPDEWAKLISLTENQAAINAALDVIMPANTLKAKKLLATKLLSKEGLKHIGTEAVKAAALELPTELAQETGTMTVAEKLGQKYSTEQRLDRYLKVAVGAGGIGFGTGTLSGTAEVAANKQKADVYKSVVEQNKIDSMAASAAEIDNPRVLSQSIDALTDPSTENVYLDASEVSTLYQNLDLDLDTPTAKAIQDQLQSATELNGDVVIPVKDFLNDVKDANYEALRPHIRLSPDSMSQTELESAPQDRVQSLIDEANKNAQIKSEADLIYQQVKDQLVDTGRLSPSAAGYSAQIIPAFVTTQAARTGKSAKEIYEMMGLKIEGPERRRNLTNPVIEGKIPPVEGDRRAEAGVGERRNPDLRAEFDALPDEEKFKIAYEDQLTGLRSKRAWDKLPPKKYRIMLDLDGLGWVNDNKGHEAGNVFLKEASRAIQEYLGTEDAFRIGGDEFAGQSDDLTDAQTKAQAIQDHLKNVTIEVRNPGEEPFTIKGIGVSYGIGENDAIADQKLYEDKARREASGERAKKGTRPPGIEPGPSDTARADQTGGNAQDTGLDVLNQEEKQSAIAKGLPMDKESRLARAREMGFDTDTVWYHGSSYDIEAFDLSESGKNQEGRLVKEKAIFLTESEDDAAFYANYSDRLATKDTSYGAVYPVYTRISNPLVKDYSEFDDPVYYSSVLVKDALDEAKAGNYDSVIFRGMVEDLDGEESMADQIAVLDPSKIRSINAAFDPDFAESSNILYQKEVDQTDALNKPDPTKMDKDEWINEHEKQSLRFAKTGEPIAAKLYHGSPDARFSEEFDPNKKGYYPELPDALPDNTTFTQVGGVVRGGFRDTSLTGNKGVSFTDDRITARSYANKPAFDYQNSVPMVLERYVTFNSPKVYDLKGKEWNLSMEAEMRKALSEGHDGLIFKNIRDDYHPSDRGKPTNNAIALNLSQIKTRQQLEKEWEAANKPSAIAQTDTPAFKKWFGSSVVTVDGKPGSEPLVVYHGTTHDFDTFTPERGNMGNDFGVGYYFTNSQDDVGVNYSGEGPDLTQRIELRAERIESEEEIDMDEARKKAREELFGGAPNTMPVYLAFENPVVFGGENETFFDYSEPFDEETEEYVEPEGKLVDIIDAMRYVAVDFDVDVETIIGQIFEKAYDGEGVSSSDLFDIIKYQEPGSYIEDNETGDLANGEFIRQVFEYADYDGVVDNTVDEKFGSSRKTGKSMEGVNPDTTHYIAFKPEQIKSAIGNRGTFSPSDPNILYQSKPIEPVFFSQLKRSVEGIKQEKGTADQFLSMIKKQPGVKAEELEWTGLEEYLRAQGPKKITKQEIVDFLDHNGVQVETVEKGMFTREIPDDTKYEIRENEDGEYDIFDPDRGVVVEGGYSLSEAEGALSEYEQGTDTETINETKFSDYQLPGGENYREVLLTLPTSKDFEKEWQQKKREATAAGKVSYDLFQKYGQDDPRTQAAMDEEKRIWDEANAMRGKAIGLFKSSHFDEPNILAHIRLNDRTDADGNKVLFVEEIQSDWHQKGRKEGYKKQGKQTLSDAKQFFGITDADWEAMSDERKESYLEEMMSDESHVLAGKREMVPDAPFKNNAWAELAIKRVLRMAAEGGYDSVAWTTGEQQAERYDLSKQVDSIDVRYDIEKNSYSLSLRKDGGPLDGGAFYNISPEKIDDYIGKDLAQKIRNHHENESTETYMRKYKEWRGVDLKVGGEGMKGFYDRMLPNLFKKVAGKLDKSAKVGETKINTGATEADGEILESIVGDNEAFTVEHQGDLREFETEQESDAYAKSLREGTASVHAIQITNKMREGAMAGQALFQEKRGQIQFTDEGSIIRMFEASDLSTFLHESSHLFLRIEGKLVGAELTKDQKTILDYLEADSFDNLTRDQEEKFARSFEAYLFEGKAPSVELRDAFSKFRDWLLQIYRSVTKLKVNLNKDIREVFDRMLATDEQIAVAQAELGYDILFNSAENAGMTQKEWDDYKARQQRAKDSPRATLQEKILGQLKRQTEQWWKEEKSVVKDQVREELDKLPVYQAMSFIKDNNKLDRTTVKELLGIKDIPPKLRNTTKEGGLNPDEVAVQFGYRNGHEMMTDISEQPLYHTKLEEESQARMLSKHGDILNDGTLEKEALSAAHDEERASVLFIELRKLSKRQNIDRETLKQKAKEVISKTVISEIRPDKYRRAEIKSAQKAAVEFKAGNKEAAAQAKAQQLANFYLWKEANNARDYADSKRKYLSGIGRRKYSTKDVHPEFIRQMKLLASVYDFRKNGNTDQFVNIAEWFEAQINSDDAYKLQYIDTNLSEAINAVQLAKETGQPVDFKIKKYDDMTVEELRGVYEQVRNLRYIGGKLSDNEKARFNAKVESLGQSIFKNGKKIVTVPEERASRDKAMEYLRQFTADHLALADHIEEMDGFSEFGPLFTEFYQKIIDSSDTELKLKKEIGEKLIEAFKPFVSNIPFKSGGLREKSFLREGEGTKNVLLSDGRTWSLSARGRVMLALYWGAPENHETIMRGHGVNESEVQQMLEYMNDKELDLVEKIWEINESLWPQSRDVNMKLTGVSLPRVEQAPYKVGNRTMPGGYMRLYYEKEVKDSVLQDVDALVKNTRAGQGVVKNTAHGSRNARVGSGGRKLSWDLNNVYRALDEVIHDISFAETATETFGILNSKPVREAIESRYGIEKYKSVQQALSNVIAGHVVGNGGLINAMMRIPRQAATYTILGYSIRNFLQQPLALGPMVSQVGEKQMLSSVLKFYSNPKKWIKFVQDNSEFMRNRTSLVNRDTAEAMNKIDSGVMSGALKRHAFDLQTIGDAIVIYPGWMAAYENGLRKFANHEKAATYASETAARSVGSGLMKDMSPLLQGKAESAKGLGPEAIKLYTFMYSYFNTMSRLVRKSAKKNDLGTLKGAGQFSREMFWILVAPALIGAWMVGERPEDDESLMEWAIKEVGLFGMSMILGLRDLASAMQGFKPTTATGRAMDSAMKIYDTTVKVIEGEKEPFSPEVVARLLRASGTIIPIPGGSQLARTLDYLGDDPEEPNLYDAFVVGKKYD